MRNFFLCIIIINLTWIEIQAQIIGQTGEPDILLRREKYGMISAHTQGYGLSYRQGKHITGKRKRMYEIEFVSMRHPKQVKSLNYFYLDSKSYYYGKLNHFFVLRPGIGQQRVLSEKPYWGGIEVRSNYYLGFSLGILKPVYLKVMKDGTNGLEIEEEEVRYDPGKHFTDNIMGRGSFFRGFDEIKPVPGAYLKYSLNFEFGPVQETVRSLEFGVNIDGFLNNVPIMAFQENQRLFVVFYVALAWGIRYD